MLSTRSLVCLLDSSSGAVSSDISNPMRYSVVDLFSYRIPILSFFRHELFRLEVTSPRQSRSTPPTQGQRWALSVSGCILEGKLP
jgi:hypothetical protein